MMKLLPALLALAATTVSAKEPFLSIPLDCTLGENCYINDYFDQDPTDGLRDYTCGTTTRDVHRGTDFALFTNKAMFAGVNVIAAAPGTVRGVREGMDDIYVTAPNAPDITGRECGNGVAVDHGGGWVSQYCHLRNGSVAVAKGDRVKTGTPLGLVGQSGQTSYPHLHFTLYHKGVRVDPFDISNDDTCGIETAKGLWTTDIPYQPAGFIRAGFANSSPKFDDIKDGQASIETMPANAPVFIAWAHLYSTQKGDLFKAEIIGPNGVFVANETVLQKGHKLGMRFTGKKRRSARWPSGEYAVTFTLVRDGVEIDSISTTTVVK